MSTKTMNKLGKKSNREVAVEVLEWWNNSTMHVKRVHLIEKKHRSGDIYRIKQKIGLFEN